MNKKKKSPVDLFAIARSARASMGEEKWASYVKEQKELNAQSFIQTKLELDHFMSSPEPAARDALEHGLNELRINAVIQKSDTCIEALDALIWCVKHNWWARDSSALLKPIGHEFKKINAREISTLPRPKAKSLFKQAVEAVMSSEKSSCQDFKTFMQMWQLGHIRGMTIKSNDGVQNYVISDESGELGQKNYKWGTLEKMYSEIN